MLVVLGRDPFLAQWGKGCSQVEVLVTMFTPYMPRTLLGVLAVYLAWLAQASCVRLRPLQYWLTQQGTSLLWAATATSARCCQSPGFCSVVLMRDAARGSQE